jgi:hypothetical protein
VTERKNYNERIIDQLENPDYRADNDQSYNEDKFKGANFFGRPRMSTIPQMRHENAFIKDTDDPISPNKLKRNYQTRSEEKR